MLSTRIAVSLSGVRALPHLLEAMYARLLPQPRLRFVLEHDPGAGKTIMAGLLIKELKLRAIERFSDLDQFPSPLWGPPEPSRASSALTFPFCVQL
jgi:hypothetical protein